MRDKIVSELHRIESEEEVRILYACESGSRAWGFPSSDSDYDVRFVYVHTRDWYLSIDDGRDVIERPVTDSLDISGWDIRKALRLLRKSNPPLLEWLRSPIVYLEEYSTARRTRDLALTCFSPRSCLHHYLSMAKGNYRDYLKGDLVKVKKYFYVLRPILACRWVETRGTMPPTEFAALVESQVTDAAIAAEIGRLLARKEAGVELNIEPRIETISQFIEDELCRLADRARRMERPSSPDTTTLDELFRLTLDEVWSD